MVDPVLLRGISVGIGFHSAALHATERRAVEEAFAKNIISALCCTSTLAAGVNLPASRVIIRSPWTGKHFITCSKYLQMVGRAGRTNIRRDEQRRQQQTKADSYIFVQPSDVGRFQDLVENHIENVTSQLLLNSTYYKRSTQTTSDRSVSVGREFTGVTRIIFSSLDRSTVPMSMSELIDIYRLTLLYQSGEKKMADDKETVVMTLQPFLVELQVMIFNVRNMTCTSIL